MRMWPEIPLYEIVLHGSGTYHENNPFRLLGMR
jgi:hypothetical protein